MEAITEPRVALVHDWLTGMRGGEKCLEVLCRRFPHAPLFTLLHRRGTVSPIIEQRRVHTSWIQRLPGNHKYYRYFLPLMPWAAENWRLPPCDAVVSFSHCVAKSAVPPQGVPHICYCFTPMRYAWHMQDAYFTSRTSFKGQMLDCLLSGLRHWDRRTAERVTHFIAISRTVQRRIAESYNRFSTVIYPPVDTEFYCPAPVDREDYYLVVSAFAPYKRIDLAIEACNRLNRKLVVIGTGQDARQLKALAGPTVTFLGWQSDEVIRVHMRRCRALLFPGEEDFGIVPVEAQACGTPVIAFGRGGATESVVPPGGIAEPTGLWFGEQTIDALADAIEMLESRRRDFHPEAARHAAAAFNTGRFKREMLAFLSNVLRSPEKESRQAA